MNNMTHEQKEKLLFTVSFIIAVVSWIVVIGFVAAEAYVRWNLNKDYTFLGADELPALTIGAFALLIGLLYSVRAKHSN